LQNGSGDLFTEDWRQAGSVFETGRLIIEEFPLRRK
jgi:hypothetical protein